MNDTHNKSLVRNSKMLRKQMTKEECHLWYDFLKTLPITVHRQKVIGDYIVDFYIASSNRVIELDGSQNYETEHHQKDRERDNYLRSLGLTVLRYSNSDIHRCFDDVCHDILNHINSDENTSSDG